MKKNGMALFIALLMLQPALAGVGKSYEQCVNLYGEPAGGKDRTWVFFAGELVYVCDFDFDNVCNGMMAGAASELPLTNAEIKLVLDTNPYGGTWTPEPGSDSRWKHSSGKWIAVLNRGRLRIQPPS